MHLHQQKEKQRINWASLPWLFHSWMSFLHLGHLTNSQSLVLPAFEYLHNFFAVSIRIHSKVLLKFFFSPRNFLFTFDLTCFMAILVLIWAFPFLSIDFPPSNGNLPDFSILFYFLFPFFFYFLLLSRVFIVLFFTCATPFTWVSDIVSLNSLQAPGRHLNWSLYVWSIPLFPHSSLICNWIATAWLYLACSFLL